MLLDISEIGSQNMEQLYSLDEINDFFDNFSKTVEVKDFFPRCGKDHCFIESTSAYSEL